MLFGKGKAEMTLARVAFAPGDVIEGTLTLTLKKPVKARGVKVMLYGERAERRRDARGHATTRTVRVFDHVVQLEGEREFPPGTQLHQFQLPVPHDVLGPPKGPAGGAMEVVTMLLSGPSAVRWYVRGFLDVPLGLDVGKTLQVTIAPPRAP